MIAKKPSDFIRITIDILSNKYDQISAILILKRLLSLLQKQIFLKNNIKKSQILH